MWLKLYGNYTLDLANHYSFNNIPSLIILGCTLDSCTRQIGQTHGN